MTDQSTDTNTQGWKDNLKARIEAVDARFDNHVWPSTGVMVSGIGICGATVAGAMSLSSGPVATGLTVTFGIAAGISVWWYGIASVHSMSASEKIMPGIIAGVVMGSIAGGASAPLAAAKQAHQQELQNTPSLSKVAENPARARSFRDGVHAAHYGTYPAIKTYETESGERKKVTISAPAP